MTSRDILLFGTESHVDELMFRKYTLIKSYPDSTPSSLFPMNINRHVHILTIYSFIIKVGQFI